jgi:hypothetical protein
MEVLLKIAAKLPDFINLLADASKAEDLKKLFDSRTLASVKCSADFLAAESLIIFYLTFLRSSGISTPTFSSSEICFSMISCC